MKKIGAILIISLLFVFPIILNLVSAQEVPGLPSQLQPENVEKTKEKVETKWEYLQKEWRTIFLKNKYISYIDKILTKINIVFVILFGENYSLSISLLVIIILWIYFLYMFFSVLRDYSAFSEGISFLLSFALVVIASQLKIWSKISGWIMWLLFEDKPWYASLILAIVILAALGLLLFFIKSYGSNIVENRKKNLQEEAEQKMKTIIKTGEEIEKGLK